MKKSILISGIAGSGKSFIAKYLNKIGIESYDIEDYGNLFKMYRKDTNKVFYNYDNRNIQHVKNSKWICDLNLLKKLIKNQKTSLAFYCGIAENIDEIIPLFDEFFLLKASNNVLYKRLCKRHKRNEYGGIEEVRQMVLKWKDEFEKRMESKGAIIIDADSSSNTISKRILEKIS